MHGKRLRQIVFLSSIVTDQASKLAADKWLMHLGSLDVTGFFALTYAENTGISFGMLQGVDNRLLLALNALLTTALYAYWKRIERTGAPALESWSLSLICAGACGNIIDRILRGAVVDFLDFKFWPIFNLADSVITVGAILYLAGTLTHRKHDAA
ncbi:MAG: signal peptidase II [Elusimicrobiota bacterium]